jgi:hypothetical protein
MKIIVEQPTPKDTKPYPKLMKSRVGGAIYWLTVPRTGVRIAGGVANLPTCEYSSAWAEDSFEDFEGTIILDGAA